MRRLDFTPIVLSGFALIAVTGCGGDSLVASNSHAQQVEDRSEYVQRFRREFLIEMNAARSVGRACGIRVYPAATPVKYNPLLNTAAQLFSQDMARRRFFDHRTPEGVGPGERLKAANYRSCTWGENIALGVVDAKRVVSMWLKSPGHCANLMSGKFNEIGFGVAKGLSPHASRETIYFTLDLGRDGDCKNLPDPEYIEVEPTAEGEATSLDVEPVVSDNIPDEDQS